MSHKQKINLVPYQKFFPEITFQYLLNWYFDHRNKKYMSSAIWGSIFLESFLHYFLDQLNIEKDAKIYMNQMIYKLEKYSNSSKEINIPFDIISRFHEIRRIRNRLVHHSGLPKIKIQTDSDSIREHVLTIIDWYKDLKIVKELSKSKEEEKIPVFISAITPHRGEQEYFLEMFKNKLEEIGIQPVRMRLSKYDAKDPIGKVCNVIKECKGMIVLGFERSHSYFLREKEGSEDQKEITHRKYTSSWLHLEAGIAHALGLDIFVLCEKEINEDGIFDRNWNSYTVLELESLNKDSHELLDFFDHIKEWVVKHNNK